MMQIHISLICAGEFCRHLATPEPPLLIKRGTAGRGKACLQAPSVMHASVRSPALLLWLLSALLSTSSPAEAWYKQGTGPSFHSVGRASGLLSGLRRSPHARRTSPESDGSAENLVGKELRSASVCIRDVSPDLQSCELLKDDVGLVLCTGHIFLSLDSRDCDSSA
ncbi:neuropeptide B-like [Denticeps clupeoides]|uniref:neuropeptide B-like n=1 Tax=Denticeps clupeoides TaxID=299321 RepID=UPI0010A3E3D1|nr:neuropeptide B-like [Denticeps clupeoides]XP_028821805.1 neuropeptide B-like [Denticeps clupeoides]XP_028841463.1 neuropeptide B-like [Denticeps clupeoides]XP_028841464.1 neuropeptide B-like [Denticeps clupeoides]